MAFLAQSRLLRTFNRTLKDRPFLVNAAIYGGTCAAGELTLQLINESDKPINWVRIAHFGIIGASFNGPVGHLWYTWLDKLLPGTAFRTLAKKLFLDQTIAGSAYVVAFYVGKIKKNEPVDLVERPYSIHVLYSIYTDDRWYREWFT